MTWARVRVVLLVLLGLLAACVPAPPKDQFPTPMIDESERQSLGFSQASPCLQNPRHWKCATPVPLPSFTPTLPPAWTATPVPTAANTATVVAVETATAVAQATATAVATSVPPSGQSMPTADPIGWRRVFADDFLEEIPLGGWSGCLLSTVRCSGLAGTSYETRWWAYPDGWRDTSGNGTYYPSRVLSIHNGVLDTWLRTESGVHLVAAVLPRGITERTSARIAVRFRGDPLPCYKTAWLLWPDSEVWPRDGEIDYPEGNLTGNIWGFVHRQGALTGADQFAVSSGVSSTGWHTAITQWNGGQQVSFSLDGVHVGTTTERVPNTPMHLVLMTESWVSGCVPAADVNGHVLLDWIVVWVPS